MYSRIVASRREIRLLLTALLCTMAAASRSTFSQVVVLGGRARVQVLSPTLLRIEPKGPKGFEDRTTFTVVERNWTGAPLHVLNETSTEAWLATSGTLIHVTAHAAPVPLPPPPTPAALPPVPMCAARNNTDFVSRTTGPMHGAAGGGDHPLISYLQDVSQAECCDACSKLAELAEKEKDFGWPIPGIGCGAWVWQPSKRNCSLLKWGIESEYRPDRVAGGIEQPGRLCGADYPCCGGDHPGKLCEPNPGTGLSASVFAADGSRSRGALLWSVADLANVSQHLFWPAPLTQRVYALSDFPRFFAPPWGPTPIPDHTEVDPDHVGTSGYDFSNNQVGDTYLFLLGDSLVSDRTSRQEFSRLAGPSPLIPDFAFGTWFTWWTTYTETEAKADIARWNEGRLPIDVWGLDMNWRDTQSDSNDNFTLSPDDYYIFPNSTAFPDFAGNSTAWFDYLKSQKLRTYFNDHPYVL